MTDGGRSPVDPASGPEGGSGSAGDDGPIDGESGDRRRLRAADVLAGARHRLAANPRALAALLLAGLVIALTDWLRLHDPVPTGGFVGIQQGTVRVRFGLVVTVAARTTLPLAALPGLEPAWLLSVVGLALFRVAVVTLAATYALGRLLDVEPSTTAVLRYGAVLSVLEFGAFTVNFEGGAALLGLPFVIAYLFVTVRLVPLPGRLVLGEPLGTALRRSWATARGYGWSLFGVVLVVGVVNHLLASVPVVGPVGSGAAAALHAGVVAVAVDRLPASGDGGESRPEGVD